MCGRYTLTCAPETLSEAFRLESVTDLPPRYNIAPSQQVTCVRTRSATRTRDVVGLRWGLVPSWTRDPAVGNTLINARAETAADKPAFRTPFRERRCLVLADGYYEWKREGTRTQPYHIRFNDGRPFAFAGLWDRWTGQDGTVLESCAILTTRPNACTASIHDRMPVIVCPAEYDPWIDPALRTVTRLAALVTPYPSDAMVATPVGAIVNNPRCDDARCLDAIHPFSP